MAEIIVTAERELYTDTEWLELLADVDTVIRCRDCKKTASPQATFCKEFGRLMPPDGYCFCGIPRDNSE